MNCTTSVNHFVPMEFSATCFRVVSYAAALPAPCHRGHCSSLHFFVWATFCGLILSVPSWGVRIWEC